MSVFFSGWEYLGTIMVVNSGIEGRGDRTRNEGVKFLLKAHKEKKTETNRLTEAPVHCNLDSCPRWKLTIMRESLVVSPKQRS